ncbi:MAG: cyanophycinase [Kofleriaceae bacterium]|nr:cyanophycinase [Kofleriaceae bacterium]MCB9570724.1 cyanophycinase [Kofleriaceae bacterium]
MSPARVESEHRRGWIVPVGGAEDKIHDVRILRRFTEIAGGADARIAVIPTASKLADTGARYERLFEDIGVASVRALAYAERGDASRADWYAYLEQATGIFLTGGDQLRLSTILGGTPIAKLLRSQNARGVSIGGTSAGAAILSEHMIAFGTEGATPLAGAAVLAPGFGLTNRVIIDQHFRQRDRLGRLLSALAYNPFATGLGLDEDTAAFLDPDDRVEVVGSGAITVVDVSGLTHSSMAQVAQGEPICMTGVQLHVLTNGATFNLHTRVASPPPRAHPESA